MTSHDDLDQTPFHSANCAIEWSQRASDVEVRFSRSLFPVEAVEFTTTSTLTRMTRGLADDRELTDQTSETRALVDPLSERENDTRIRLLARRYSGVTLNVEDEARLAIATERVRLLIPRVSAADMEHLAAKFENLRQISETLEDIKRGIEDEF